VLVAAVGHSKRSLVARAAEILRTSGSDMTGLVVNFVRRNDRNSCHQDYASYYHEPIPEFEQSGLPTGETEEGSWSEERPLNNLRRG